MKKILSTILLFYLYGIAYAQTTVSGRVTGSGDGEGLPGVNILVKGTSKGTITDIDGRYSIQVPSSETSVTLVFTFTGFLRQEIPVNNRSNINIVLVEDVKALEEVVVVGYGTQKRSDISGAVASVSEKDLRVAVTTNIDQALQGRVAGVQITQNSGQPGGAASIRVRGASSITGSNEPLYVIDGIPFDGVGVSTAGFSWAGGANGQNRVNPLSTINPNDIVSIEVLKDASSTAIYGSRAANGVILITTRRGKKGESKISYNAHYGLQTIPRKLGMMNLPEYADYQLQVTRENNMQVNERYLDPSLLGQGTDWQDEVFRSAGMQNHQISVTGGTDKTSYAITGGIFKQDGIIIGSGFERFTTRINLENQVKDWLKVGTNMTFANTQEQITLNDGGDGVIMQSLIMAPDIPVRDMNGNYAGPDNNLGGVNFNPVAAALQRNNTLHRQRLLANVYADASLAKNLNFRTEVGFDNNHGLNKAFHPTFQWGGLINKENMLRQREENNFFFIFKNYLTYSLKLGEQHNIRAMVGTETQRSSWEGSEVTKRNFASNDIQVLSQGENANTLTNGWKDGSSLASYFGRVNYAYADRYLLEGTLRGDGSSKFGPNNRWGYFPSASFGWRFSNEAFLSSVKNIIYDGKLRLSYGQVGNQAIPNYMFGSSMVTMNTPFGTAYRMQNIANPNIRWEATSQFNAGIDFSLFEGRVDVTFDAYDRQTKDMLLRLTVPSYLGGSGWMDIQAPFANVGRMQNRGFDLAVTTHNIKTNKFQWTTNAVFSRNRNMVLELDAAERVYWGSLNWYSEFQTASMNRAGHPLGVFYGFVVEGIFKDQQDILNHAVQVPAPGSVSDSNPFGVNHVDRGTGVWIGDVKFKDINGDGVIDTRDQVVIGDPNPKFTFGFNNTFSYGAFDMSVFLNGVYGGDILNYSRVMTEGQVSLFSNQGSAVVNRARYGLHDASGSETDPANVYLANPGTNMPRFTTNDVNRNNRMSDRFIEDGSFVRIQNIKLAYTLPSNLTKKFKVERLRTYVNIQNLYTFTKYSGYDPEIGAFNQSPLLQNVDMGRYPTPRVFTVGIDVDF
jgi:TonB-dependent starch-binding outer membrane protein SusC